MASAERVAWSVARVWPGGLGWLARDQLGLTCRLAELLEMGPARAAGLGDVALVDDRVAALLEEARVEVALPEECGCSQRPM